jgi:hypothetical protein
MSCPWRTVERATLATCASCAVRATAARVRAVGRDTEARREWHRAYGKQRRADHVPFLVCELQGCDKLVDEWNRRICQMHRVRMRRYGSYELPFLTRRVCVGCGTPFATNQPNKIRCRKACGKDYRTPVEAPVRECKQCGSSFTSRHAAAVCSQACRGQRAREYGRLWNREHRPGTAVEEWPVLRRTCKACSVVFETVYPWQVYHVPKCGQRHSEKGVARKKAENRMRTLRLRLWQRDAKCYGCGHEIDYSLKSPHQWSPEVDHLTPLSMGGRTDMDNLAVMHRQCNADKGDRDAGSWERNALAVLRHG